MIIMKMYVHCIRWLLFKQKTHMTDSPKFNATKGMFQVPFNLKGEESTLVNWYIDNICQPLGYQNSDSLLGSKAIICCIFDQ